MVVVNCYIFMTTVEMTGRQQIRQGILLFMLCSTITVAYETGKQCTGGDKRSVFARASTKTLQDNQGVIY